MLRYVLPLSLATVPTLWAVITLCYLLLHLTPCGPFDSELALANLKAKYLLDLPLW